MNTTMTTPTISPAPAPPPREDDRITLRAAMIILIALLAGLGGAWLTYESGLGLPQSTLVAAAAFGTTAPLAGKAIR